MTLDGGYVSNSTGVMASSLSYHAEFVDVNSFFPLTVRFGSWCLYVLYDRGDAPLKITAVRPPSKALNEKIK